MFAYENPKDFIHIGVAKMDYQKRKDIILSASGEKRAQLVLKSAKVVNVFTEEIEEMDVAISEGYIVGLGKYEGDMEVDLHGYFICPGFIDGHMHLESSMLVPAEFECASLPGGTTAIVSDPHEIANVAGTEGIDYMLAASDDLLMKMYFTLPSCVPASKFDEPGEVLVSEQLRRYYDNERVLGLAELMDAHQTIKGNEEILAKIQDAKGFGKIVDGHAPGLAGNQINAYVAAGVQSDHECASMDEALEKLKRGQWIMIREGTAAKNMESLLPLCKKPYSNRCMFVTDDRHTGDLLSSGHMDAVIRKAVSLGVEPVTAIKMCTFNTAQYFNLKESGAVAPGYRADLTVLSDLKEVNVHQVYIDGKLVVQDRNMLKSQHKLPENKKIWNSFHMNTINLEQLKIKNRGEHIRAIKLIEHELLTEEYIAEWTQSEGMAPGVNLSQDLVKITVFERHHNTGHVGIGFLQGYGLKSGAIATSVAHDSHNLIVVGTNDEDILTAANAVREQKGGIAIARDGKILGELALPIAGLMTPEPIEVVDTKLKHLKFIASQLGVSQGIDPFMTLSFVSLPVIPKLRLNGHGLIDCENQRLTEVTF